MRNLVAFPLLVLALIVQSAILSRISLLSGAADLTFLILVSWTLQERVDTWLHWAFVAGILAGFVSGLPPFTYFLGYMLVVAFARLVQRQVWQTPILALFTVTFFGTLLMHMTTYTVLWLNGSPISFEDTLALITLPSLFLNFILVLPIHNLIRDLAGWVYPVEELL
jgi:rod shape-determining protein MreD